jgi:hypothetical protein
LNWPQVIVDWNSKIGNWSRIFITNSCFCFSTICPLSHNSCGNCLIVWVTSYLTAIILFLRDYDWFSKFFQASNWFWRFTTSTYWNLLINSVIVISWVIWSSMSKRLTSYYFWGYSIFLSESVYFSYNKLVVTFLTVPAAFFNF